MAQFNIYRIRGVLVLDVQSDLTASHGNRVVIPLMVPSEEKAVLTRLEPIFDIDGNPHVLHTGELLAVSEKLLGPPIADLYAEQDRVKAALDFLFYGF